MAISPAENRANRRRIRLLAYTAILFAVTLALSFLEALLPPLAGPLPLNYGLSNIPIMWVILEGSPLVAFLLTLAKVLLNLSTKGGMAALLSLSGGLVSVLVMTLAAKIRPDRLSIFLFSLLGAVSHNLAQLACLLLFFPQAGSAALVTLFPFLIFLGIGTSFLTAFLLHLLLPRLPTLPLYQAGRKRG